MKTALTTAALALAMLGFTPQTMLDRWSRISGALEAPGNGSTFLLRL
jgi:hypothetical protein